jgi:hypothetical protein
VVLFHPASSTVDRTAERNEKAALLGPLSGFLPQKNFT